MNALDHIRAAASSARSTELSLRQATASGLNRALSIVLQIHMSAAQKTSEVLNYVGEDYGEQKIPDGMAAGVRAPEASYPPMEVKDVSPLPYPALLKLIKESAKTIRQSAKVLGTASNTAIENTLLIVSQNIESYATTATESLDEEKERMKSENEALRNSENSSFVRIRELEGRLGMEESRYQEAKRRAFQAEQERESLRQSHHELCERFDRADVERDTLRSEVARVGAQRDQLQWEIDADMEQRKRIRTALDAHSKQLSENGESLMHCYRMIVPYANSSVCRTIHDIALGMMKQEDTLQAVEKALK